jgi:hypothetical protein
MVGQLVRLLDLSLALLHVADLRHTVGVTAVEDAEWSWSNAVSVLGVSCSMRRRAVRALIRAVFLTAKYLRFLLWNNGNTVINVPLLSLFGALDYVLGLLEPLLLA